MALSKHEKDLYSRQLGVPGWGVEGQERLKEAHAFVAGVGGLGCASDMGQLRMSAPRSFSRQDP